MFLNFLWFNVNKHALSTFEAENRLFHKHAGVQLKKVRTYKKNSVYWAPRPPFPKKI